MFKSPKKVLAKWAAEALAIALGVFLGITAESIWQERNDRSEEIQHLIALRDDFLQSLKILDAEEEIQNDQVQYLQFLLLGKAETAEPRQIRVWIRVGLYFTRTYEPQLSALRDLESSGKMQLIQNANLRRALATLNQDIDELENSQSEFVAVQQDLVDPYLVSHIDLLSTLDIGELSTADSNSPLEFDRSLFSSMDLRNRIAFKLSVRRAVMERQVEVRAQFEHLLELIQEQLGSD
jgi:hypothetical protein